MGGKRRIPHTQRHPFSKNFFVSVGFFTFASLQVFWEGRTSAIFVCMVCGDLDGGGRDESASCLLANGSGIVRGRISNPPSAIDAARMDRNPNCGRLNTAAAESLYSIYNVEN